MDRAAHAPPAHAAQPAATSRATSRHHARQLTLGELADGFIASYSGRDPAVVSRLGYWCDHFGAARDPWTITSDDVEDALADLAANGQRQIYLGRDRESGARKFKASDKAMAPATLNRYLTTLGSLYKFAKKRRLSPRGFVSPTRGVERQPEHNAIVRFLTDKERERLLACARVSTWSRLYLLVLMALTTGARKGELLSLRWREIDLARAHAYLPPPQTASDPGRTKNRMPRVLPLIPAVVEEMQRIRRREPQAFVFPSERYPAQPMRIEKPWQQALRAAGIKRFRFHDLRHCCASYLAQNGATLLEIADVLGHQQLAMVRRYAHLSTASKTTLIGRVLGDLR
jgi:integrase